MDREAALADFDVARQEWEAAFGKVPDAALTYLKQGDDYALGGLQVHVVWVLEHYRRVLGGIVSCGFGPVGPQDPPGAEERARDKARRGLQPGERAESLREMERLHKAVREATSKLPSTDWNRKAPVVYGQGEEPYPTCPEDIVGWLREHYREHVTQSAELIADWKVARAAG